MKQKSVAIVGAAETTELGKIPDLSQIQLHADAALNALADAGLTLKDIDGVASAGHNPTEVAHYLGITPTWVDGTSVGGCSFMLHVRHAAAAIEAGLCDASNSVRVTRARVVARRPAFADATAIPTCATPRRRSRPAC